jgi:hypothetical protein
MRTTWLVCALSRADSSAKARARTAESVKTIHVSRVAFSPWCLRALAHKQKAGWYKPKQHTRPPLSFRVRVLGQRVPGVIDALKVAARVRATAFEARASERATVKKSREERLVFTLLDAAARGAKLKARRPQTETPRPRSPSLDVGGGARRFLRRAAAAASPAAAGGGGGDFDARE